MSRGKEEIINTEVSQELSESFLEYSMSVIVSRALPDVRDGLKPVHRRILWSMYTQGMRPERGYNKCARATGDIMGKYHPHGDAAIYDALVRMAQPWSMRVPLIDGHGNFGSLDDGPAAARYTECRLSTPSMSMVTELEEDTVDFRPNYDGREKEPVVLPASFPNLLVNGSTGIAVGMATNMPPHNLGEVIDATVALLYDETLTVEEIMKYIPGPDFPTGGVIHGTDGVKDSYLTGKGSFKIRAKYKFDNDHGKKRSYTFTELPYGVGPEKVIGRIKDLVRDKKILGISDIKNYSDRKVGLKLVIEIKNGFDHVSLLEDLFRLTPLEDGYSVSNVALVNNQPRTLGIFQILKYYIEHRKDVVRRRTEYRLRKAEARAHILLGLIVAQKNIEEIVALIKGSKDTQSARKKLIDKYELSEVQAEAILEMTLRRLTSLEVSKLIDEERELQKQIKEFKKILNNKDTLRDLVAEELLLIKSEYTTKRKTEIVEHNPVLVPVDISPIDDKDIILAVSNKMTAFSIGNKKIKPTDQVISIFNTKISEKLICITNKGRAFLLPNAEFAEKSKKILENISLEPKESLIGFTPSSHAKIFIVTRMGVVKSINSSDLVKNGTPVIKLKAGDEVVSAFGTSDKSKCVLITKESMCLRVESNSVNPQGLGAGGVAGMKVKESDEIIYAGVLNDDEELGFITNINGYKVITGSDLPVKNRGGQGYKIFNPKKGETNITNALSGKSVRIINSENTDISEGKKNKKEGSTVISKTELKAVYCFE